MPGTSRHCTDNTKNGCLMDTKNFKASEFACPCCGRNEIKGELMEALQQLRNYLGYPIIINSGYRCKRHNAKVGGVSNSQHLYGIAADIYVAEISTAELSRAANEIKAFRNGGIGTYGTWVHVDIRKKRARWRG